MRIIKKKKCGCQFILIGNGGLSTISAGKIIKKCEKHKNMTEKEIRSEPYKDIIKKFKKN